MSMNNRNRFKNSRSALYNKFRVAFIGIKIVVIEESSIRYQLIVLALAVGLGLFFSISFLEWFAIIFFATLVFTIEAINTAIENIVDLVCPSFDVQAGRIKDISAAAVLFSALGALIVGVIIFAPKGIEFIINFI